MQAASEIVAPPGLRNEPTLQKFGDERVFNTPIQEAFIIGSTAGMSAVGLKPIVEVQFADYIWPGLNQLFTEVSRSCYLSNFSLLGIFVVHEQ